MEQPFESELRTSLKKTRSFLNYILGALLLIYCASGIYSISTNEIGVLQRFGRVVDADVRPGIHFRLPWPIDRINRVPVKEVRRIFIDDFFEQGTNADLYYRLTGLNSNCITGDNNIVTLNCVLQYTIANPHDYLFKVDQIDITLQSLASNTIIHCLAGLAVDDILTSAKAQIEIYIKSNLQERLDQIGCGINVTFIELKDVQPPSIVQHYFDDVINSTIDKRKMISKAESYQNERLPAANGQYTRMLQEAEAYRNKVQDEASGEAQRFLAQLSEYKRNPVVTRKRLYHEFIDSLYPLLDSKIVVEGDSITLRLLQSEK
ncbi:FtsH protease activity modulator HflK [bacterium]|nr:FtsH protease activity modulator HflK [bacterium]